MRIGIDLGGTKIEGIALDRAGREAWRCRIATPRHDYAATIAAIRELVEAAEAALDVTDASVGIAIPGALSPATGLIKNANSTWLIGKPLDRDLAECLGKPVRLANDANCFALSESTDGAGAGAASVFGVIVGTGTGGGIVIEGQLHEGPHLIAGECGHVPLPWRDSADGPTRQCYCGKADCVETYLSGPGLALTYEQCGGGTATAEEIVVRSDDGEPAAETALQRYEATMARALAMMVTILDPEVIVLGGGLSNIDRLYRNVPLRWQPYAFSDEIGTRLVRALHGDASGVRGAAWLWPDG